MDYYMDIYEGLVYYVLQKHARFSDCQMRALRWSQVDFEHKRITTNYKREVKLPDPLVKALENFPDIRTGGYVFGLNYEVKRTSRFTKRQKRAYAHYRLKVTWNKLFKRPKKKRKHLRLSWA